MKKLFLIALAFMFALAGSELAVAHDAAAQDNQNTQAKTSVSDTTYHRRRHRRRHLRHTVVSKTKNVTEKSKEVGEATVDKSKSVGSAVVDKSKTVGNTVAEKSKTVGRRSKHIGRKVVHKTKKAVTPQ